jgi:branched-chain amino acid transport system ATP-binding protein
MLTVEHVDVFYGDAQVLWDVSFEVGQGEIVALIGANGSGKTTVLRTISGLLTPVRGAVLFEGERFDRLQAHRIINFGVAHVPEARRLFPEMTVHENLLMGALTAEARKHRRATLEMVYGLFPRLKERSRQQAGTLSGGEQQMAAIGRGLMSRPRLLMLDEPSLGLAPLVVNDIFGVIEQVHRQGVTLLIVEQNVYRTLTVADRAYVLENGRTIMTGTGAQLIADDHVKRAYLGI